MKGKILKVVAGTFALVTALSVMPVASVSVEACEASTYEVDCSHPNLQVDVKNYGWEPVSGDEHVYVVKFDYYCPGCGDSWVELMEEYGTHTYEYDYSANRWVCDVCGDSY